jgi:hypothetical protein
MIIILTMASHPILNRGNSLQLGMPLCLLFPPSPISEIAEIAHLAARLPQDRPLTKPTYQPSKHYKDSRS